MLQSVTQSAELVKFLALPHSHLVITASAHARVLNETRLDMALSCRALVSGWSSFSHRCRLRRSSQCAGWMLETET